MVPADRGRRDRDEAVDRLARRELLRPKFGYVNPFWDRRILLSVRSDHSGEIVFVPGRMKEGRVIRARVGDLDIGLSRATVEQGAVFVDDEERWSGT